MESGILHKIIIALLLATLSILPLIAEEGGSPIPDVPEFSVTYEGEVLLCSPVELIKKKTLKNHVKYQCQRKYSDQKSHQNQEEAHGHEETQRLKKDLKNKIDQGTVYSVEIPLYAAHRPERAQILAEQQLKDNPYGKYLRMILPAKLYISLRPQLANSGDDGQMELRNAGSRGGFFYYHQFSNDMEMMFQYEAKIDLEDDISFINTSEASQSNRRLGYFALKSGDNTLIMGKYWSAYYDIASFTDRYMAYGAQSSGAFNSGTDGSFSGTGRAYKMLQARTSKETYDGTIQVQLRHDTLSDLNTSYNYTVAGSFIYSGWEDIKAGVSIDYAKLDHISSDMRNIGIDGNEFSSIAGLSYKKEKYAVNAVLSYTKNHMSDDNGTYFDGVGAELYMSYDIDESFRLAGGGNWLIPRDKNYEGEFSIKDIILSVQYTFGQKIFDDLVYLEVSFPNGKLADGENRDVSVAVGLRYLLDH